MTEIPVDRNANKIKRPRICVKKRRSQKTKFTIGRKKLFGSFHNVFNLVRIRSVYANACLKDN